MSDKIINDAWFRDARFGMFIHWGLYAFPGGIWKGKETEYIGEWLQAKFRIPNEEYEQLAAQFNPMGFDAEEWAYTASKAGMKYLVFTAKHHEGFAMYHSHCDRFNIVDATPFGRDVLAELASACRKYGLKLGLYYSQFLDWHDPDGGDPGPDSSKNFGMSWGNDWDFPDYSAKDFSRYFDNKVIPQLTELLSSYGPIAVMWFDCPMTISRDTCERLVELVRNLQPECLINTRIGHGFGDYGSFGDNLQPSARRDGACETPGTLNDTWGFKFNDQNWKSARQVVLNLAGLAEKNTNYLLNIGPGPDGRFPAGAVKVLKDVGNWMQTYGQAVHCSKGNPFPYDLPWGKITVSLGSRENKTGINLMLTDFPRDRISFKGLKECIRRCYDLARPNIDLPFICEPTGIAGLDEVIIEIKNVVPSLLPTVVIELETNKAPKIEQQLLPQEGTLRLSASVGELIHSNKSACGNLNGINVAGECFHESGHSKLDSGGNLTYWHNPADFIEWQALFPAPALYQVEVVTMVKQHSAKWHDGQTLRFSFQQNGNIHEWETVLRGKPLANSNEVCYASGIAEAGTLEIKHPGHGTLRVSMIDPGSDEGKTMNLQEIRLTEIQHISE